MELITKKYVLQEKEREKSPNTWTLKVRTYCIIQL